ncbi:MAG: sialate O-acetylesterase [Alistipes sp.]|nr:sialate O-acetylesterase [Alistipes sp.]
MKRAILSIVAVLLAWGASATIVLPKVLGSNMVLQQQTEVNLWGSAEPNKKVTVVVSWAKGKVQTVADGEGKWAVKVATPAASWDKQTITISDGEPVTLENVLIGDVWVTSGQSNMEMPLSGWRGQPIENSEKYIYSAGKYADKIRLFTVKRARSYDVDKEDCEGGEWECASPKSAANMSAVSYLFAHNLIDCVNIPIGVITSNWGGTRIESWMPMSALKEILTPEQLEAKHNTSIKPTELYCAMIAPIRNFKARGFLWYQGCSNLADHDHYDVMMARMVEQWRKDWGDEDNSMPFYYAMIAPYSYGNSPGISYPIFVECQLRALDKIPNSAMAGNTDAGEEYCIHPAKKEGLARRMAAFALRDVYGQGGVEVVSPTYASHRVDGSSIIVKFNNTGSGFYPGSGKPIEGFEIAGADRVFHKAEARLVEHEVKVWSDEVKEPVAVRYAFHNYVPCNFMHILDLPVVPFRTDNWNDVQ